MIINNSISSFSPFSGEWRVRRKFQASNHGLVFSVTSPIQDCTQGPLILTKDTLITQKIPKSLGALCQKPESKTKYQNNRCSGYSGTYQGFRSFVPEPGVPICVFLIISQPQIKHFSVHGQILSANQHITRVCPQTQLINYL